LYGAAVGAQAPHPHPQKTNVAKKNSFSKMAGNTSDVSDDVAESL
jgi:hypothetical protein